MSAVTPLPGTTRPDAPIAFFLPTFDGGGAERALITVAAELSRRGRVTELVVGQCRGELSAEVPRDLALIDLDRAHVRSTLPALVRYLRRRRPPVLVATLDHGVVAAAAAVRLAGTDTTLVPRLANTLSASPARPLTRDAIVRRASTHVYRRAACTVAVSRGAADDLSRVAGVCRSRVQVLPNPVVGPAVWEGMRAPLRHPWFASGAPPVVLGLGRLAPQKNFELLVRAFARVRETRPARLVILGDGELRDRLRSAAAHAGVSAEVDLPGFDPNPFRYLARAAAFVLSSDWEGSPASLVQALACGVPVVATDCPSGPREILDGGRFGRLVAVGDLDGLTRAIAATLESGRRPAPSVAWRPYTVADAVDAYEQLIDQVCRQRRRALVRPGDATTSRHAHRRPERQPT